MNKDSYTCSVCGHTDSMSMVQPRFGTFTQVTYKDGGYRHKAKVLASAIVDPTQDIMYHIAVLTERRSVILTVPEKTLSQRP